MLQSVTIDQGAAGAGTTTISVSTGGITSSLKLTVSPAQHG
ncbi:hypothetical protein [Actinoplanes sp. TBRC 11911]|nr:hypothetical protein [Actinoplanes sp. TBRC 11911]